MSMIVSIRLHVIQLLSLLKVNILCVSKVTTSFMPLFFFVLVRHHFNI